MCPNKTWVKNKQTTTTTKKKNKKQRAWKFSPIGNLVYCQPLKLPKNHKNKDKGKGIIVVLLVNLRNDKLGKSGLIVTLALLFCSIVIMIHARKNMAHVWATKLLCSLKEHADLREIQSNSSHVQVVLIRRDILVLFLVPETKDLRRNDWRGGGWIL